MISLGNENLIDDRKVASEVSAQQQHDAKNAELKSSRNSHNAVSAANLLSSNHRVQQLAHPLHTTSIVPPPIGPMPNMFIPRGSTVVPTAFIPPPQHGFVPPPNALQLGVGAPHPAALLHMQQQLYAQQVCRWIVEIYLFFKKAILLCYHNSAILLLKYTGIT